MDKKTAVNLARKYAEAAIKLDEKPDEIMLFGSYADNNAQYDSDIDIAVIYDTIKGNILEHYTKLWNLTWDISTLIEPILLTRDDDPVGFISEVERTGEIIWEKK